MIEKIFVNSNCRIKSYFLLCAFIFVFTVLGNAQNEIKSCTPKRIYRDQTLKIKFVVPHGGYSAISRENSEDFYLLYSDDKGNFPFFPMDKFKNYSYVKINTGTARNTNYNKKDRNGNFKLERIFSRTGWYKIMVNTENLEQGEVPDYTGVCRIYYVNHKFVKRKRKS